MPRLSANLKTAGRRVIRPAGPEAVVAVAAGGEAPTLFDRRSRGTESCFPFARRVLQQEGNDEQLTGEVAMELNRTHVIVVLNQKGGCGKTTTTQNLAAGMAELGVKVCCIDLDEQCNLCTGFGFDVNAHKSSGGYSALDIF